MKPSVPTNRWGESGRNRKGIFLRDLYIFLASIQNPSTWRNLTKTLEFSIKTRSWRCVFSPDEKEKCIFCQTARSRYLSTILVARGGEKDKHEKNCGRGGLLSKEGKQRFQQRVPRYRRKTKVPTISFPIIKTPTRNSVSINFRGWLKTWRLSNRFLVMSTKY